MITKVVWDLELGDIRGACQMKKIHCFPLSSLGGIAAVFDGSVVIFLFFCLSVAPQRWWTSLLKSCRQYSRGAKQPEDSFTRVTVHIQ